ncbi:MAG TPA: DUF1488 family protein [Dongiaceae bacterium]
MSLSFDREAYSYNQSSRSILFAAKEGETKVHFVLPRIILQEYVGEDLTADADMWQAFRNCRDRIEVAAQAHWNAIAEQHQRDGTAMPLATPLVLVSLDG